MQLHHDRCGGRRLGGPFRGHEVGFVHLVWCIERSDDWFEAQEVPQTWILGWYVLKHALRA